MKINTLLRVLGVALSATSTVSCAAPQAGKTAVSTAPITQISLQQTLNGWGAGQDYTLTLRANGQASFVGVKHATLQGRYVGAISKTEFARLAQLLRAKNFPKFDEPAVPPPTDQARTTVSIMRAGKVEFAIEEGGGPKALGEIAQQLRAYITQIKWKKVAPPKPTPKRAKVQTNSKR